MILTAPIYIVLYFRIKNMKICTYCKYQDNEEKVQLKSRLEDHYLALVKKLIVLNNSEVQL